MKQVCYAPLVRANPRATSHLKEWRSRMNFCEELQGDMTRRGQGEVTVPQQLDYLLFTKPHTCWVSTVCKALWDTMPNYIYSPPLRNSQSNKENKWVHKALTFKYEAKILGIVREWHILSISQGGNRLDRKMILIGTLAYKLSARNPRSMMMTNVLFCIVNCFNNTR